MVGVIFAIDHLDDDVLGISHHQVVFSLILNLKVQSNLAVREFYVSNIKWSSLVKVNPLSPKSDQHQISPCNINALLNRVVMRITDLITHDEFA